MSKPISARGYGFYCGVALLLLGAAAIAIDIESWIIAKMNRDPHFRPITTAPIGLYVAMPLIWIGTQLVRRGIKPPAKTQDKPPDSV